MPRMTTSSTYPIDGLRQIVAGIKAAGGGNPRVHPNGFIQLDLAEVEGSWHESHKKGHSGAARRLHIWNPPDIELPHQGTVNEVHTHVFDMQSRVVRGMLVQCLYEFMDRTDATPPTHEMYRAVYAKNSDSRLDSTGRVGTLRAYERFGVRAGFTYTQRAHTFHDTETPEGLCVTLMTKTKVHNGDAYVVCPINTPPDNSFDRASAAPVELLWEAIERSLA